MAPASSGIAKKMGKYPDIAQWLEKSDNRPEDTEHNIEREHHQWTSEPELCFYNPGIEPQHVSRSKQIFNTRRRSIESTSCASASGILQGNPSPLAGNFGKITPSKSTRKMRVAKANNGVLSSSKSDSYHKKYVWDMVFHERAVVAIQEECRQIRKIKAKNGGDRGKHHNRHAHSSILSSGDDCSGASCFHKHHQITQQTAAASMGLNPAQFQPGSHPIPNGYPMGHPLYGMNPHMLQNMDNSQLESVSRHHSKHSKHSNHKKVGIVQQLSADDKRKFSQTGSSIFAQFDMRYKEQMARGRHPATQQSQSAEKMDDGSRNNSASKTVKPDLNNNLTSGGGKSGGISTIPNTSGTTTAGPLYPTMPYMDPFMMQYMMQGMGMPFNPMFPGMQANPYQFKQQASMFNPFMNSMNMANLMNGGGAPNAPNTTPVNSNLASQLNSASSSNAINPAQQAKLAAQQALSQQQAKLAEKAAVLAASNQNLAKMENLAKIEQKAQQNNNNKNGPNPMGSPSLSNKNNNNIQKPINLGNPNQNSLLARKQSLAGSTQNFVTKNNNNNTSKNQISATLVASSPQQQTNIARSQNAPSTHGAQTTHTQASNCGVSSNGGTDLRHQKPGIAHSSTPSHSTNNNKALSSNNTDFHGHSYNHQAQQQQHHHHHHAHHNHQFGWPHAPPSHHSHHQHQHHETPFSMHSSSGIHSSISKKPAKTSVSDYLNQLKGCVDTLKQSGWYWGHISGEQAMRTVAQKGVGAFLIRDSNHQKFLFTVTVCTSNGATNVRIVYRQGLFGLDCEDPMTSKVRFGCVVKMVAYYVNNSRKYKKIKDKKAKQKALENGGASSRGGSHGKKSSSKYSSSGRHSHGKHSGMHSGSHGMHSSSHGIHSSRHSTSHDAATTTNTHSNSDTSSDKSSVALLLLKPCKKEPCSLKHLARVSLNRKLARKSTKEQGITLQTLIHDEYLLDYCQNYPYNI